MIGSPRFRHWFRFILLWAALLGGIWWQAATLTLKYVAVPTGQTIISQFGSLIFLKKIVAVEKPQPPSREEIIGRGIACTLLAIFGWITIRIAIRQDREAQVARHHKLSASHSHDPRPPA
jgi:hypothetical protein